MSSFLSGLLGGFGSGFQSQLDERESRRRYMDFLRNAGLLGPMVGGSYAKGSTFNDKKVGDKVSLKCSYCLNIYYQRIESCPSCGAREFNRT